MYDYDCRRGSAQAPSQPDAVRDPKLALFEHPVDEFTKDGKRLLKTLTDAVAWLDKPGGPAKLDNMEKLEEQMHVVLNECFDKLQKVQHAKAKLEAEERHKPPALTDELHQQLHHRPT